MTEPAPKRGSYLDVHSTGVLRVAPNTDPKRLASAIMAVARRTSRLAVRAAGARAVNIALKACIIADGYAAQRGRTFFMHPIFDLVAGDKDGDDEVTIIQINLVLVALGDIAPLYEPRPS